MHKLVDRYVVNFIVNCSPHQLDLVFGALAHPIRRGILARLATGEATIAELAKPFKVSAPAIILRALGHI